ncbi:uncharacterized protein F4822DRAFT_207048 [Hypoxylon trugodes]|uniref:uncharacterized protein n=1 Tax=Hypoxylon trugodes TaxID=326681 RepID=UPI00219077F5|nr:uncharacterized protein F4822DRAFT_207048 [Hypoxylon trugodes]KAI1389645.1 hypothetical protein F4822DRAFT_207048 [Hypoxylon trugodes]
MALLRPVKRTVASPTRLRQIVIISVICLALYCFLLVPEHSLDSSRSTIIDTFPRHPHHSDSSPNSKQKANPPSSVLNNFHLTTAQCRSTFPYLTQEIDHAVAKGPFTLTRRPHDMGPLIARIRNGKLSILSYARRSDLSREMLQHRSATLHQIANALLTTPPDETPADTIIAFNHEDDPLSPSLSYSRPADPVLNGADKHIFPIPHFSFYAWPIATVGSFPRASSAISVLESEISWSNKQPQAIWRGTTWFNHPRAGRLRQDLVASTKSQPWADIAPLVVHANGSSNGLPIEDFCRYRYIIHTEGVTYSGRFQYHQLCASVVLSPPIAWMQHVTHLVRPVFSHALPGVERTLTSPAASRKEKLAPYPASWVKSAWPKSYNPATEANMVFVAPDWSDLEATIAWLEAHPKIAEGIARRQRELFHGAGYLSPAAEKCYWRALLRGWSSVVRTDGQTFEDLDEIPWEEFSLKEIHK